ncbi:radical SAM protein [Sulfurimonas sp.]|uniref:B12-binding domain-containing radical SAM protein n=1 Tax=Sulfurimonas sp. TaxID=2022749 RepID=UPI003569AB35
MTKLTTDHVIYNFSNMLKFDFSLSDKNIIYSIYTTLKNENKKVAFFGRDKLCRYMLNTCSEFGSLIEYILEVDEHEYLFNTEFFNINVIDINQIPKDIDIIFDTFNDRSINKYNLNVKIFSLNDVDKELIPGHSSFYNIREIYPDIAPLEESFFRFVPNLSLMYDNSSSDIFQLNTIFNYLNNNNIKILRADEQLSTYVKNFNQTIYKIEDINDNDHVFILATDIDTILKTKKELNKKFHTIEIETYDILSEIDFTAIAKTAWLPYIEHIYPFNIPEITLEKNLDFLLLDLPAKKDGSMPNGLAYLHNKLKTIPEITFQTVDYDVVLYHEYHQRRILNGTTEYKLKNGYILPENMWLEANAFEWDKEETMEFFADEIENISLDIIKASPKSIGFSLHFSNILFSKKVLQRVKQDLPDIVCIVGGMNCTNHTMGRLIFEEADYMVIGEGELTTCELLKALKRSEMPKDMDGIISRYDSVDRIWTPAPLEANLDSLEFPQYDWFHDVSIYTRFNGYKPAQVVTSRGCHWAKCTFCAECFVWRQHSAIRVVDEIEWLYGHGFYHFSFNESDFNGDPDKIADMCREIIKRGLKITMIGQLRIDHRNNVEFMTLMRKAGFTIIRFGVDGWSKQSLRVQKKGYPKKMITQNLVACKEAGIVTETNMVIGVPGEREEDILETIEFALQHKKYIHQMAFIHSLMLLAGSQYYDNPENFNIKFFEDKYEIYKKYPHFVPNDLWYSEKPFIDEKMRIERFQKVCVALLEGGMRIGSRPKLIAEGIIKGRTIEDITQGKSVTNDT